MCFCGRQDDELTALNAKVTEKQCALMGALFMVAELRAALNPLLTESVVEVEVDIDQLALAADAKDGGDGADAPQQKQLTSNNNGGHDDEDEVEDDEAVGAVAAALADDEHDDEHDEDDAAAGGTSARRDAS